MKFEWLLTENIKELSGYTTVDAGEIILPDIENEFFYFDGWLSISFNQRKWEWIPTCFENKTGYLPLDNQCPMRGCDSILEFLTAFRKVTYLHSSESFLFEPMDKSRIDLLFEREGDKLKITERWSQREIASWEKKPEQSQKRKKTEIEHWTEIISFEEYCEEISGSLKVFLRVISENNPALLDNRYVKALYSDVK